MLTMIMIVKVMLFSADHEVDKVFFCNVDDDDDDDG